LTHDSAKYRQIPKYRPDGTHLYRKRFHFGLLAILCAATYSGSCLAQSEPGSVARLYNEHCSGCHGDKGDGASHAQQGLIAPAKDVTDPIFAQSMTRDSLIAVITHGKPGTEMIGWQSELSAAEIAALADHLLEQFMSPAEVPAAEAIVATNDSEATRIYQESCSVCHGDDGTGAVWGQESLSVAPRNFTNAKARAELSRERMIAAVTFGSPGTPMPGFSTQLNPDQVEMIVDYIRSRFMSGSPASAASRNTIASGEYHRMPFENGISGIYEQGRVIYMSNCVACHGVYGDGNGPRAYFIFPRPRSFLDPATQQILNRPRLFVGVRDGVIGREMPAWSNVMNDQSIADVAEYVYREFIQSE